VEVKWKVKTIRKDKSGAGGSDTASTRAIRNRYIMKGEGITTDYKPGGDI